MSSEELVALIQAGERDRLVELWEQVRRFAWKQGRRWLMALDGRGGVTQEDLQQCAFLALMAATDSFDPGHGKSFIGWYALHLKTAFSEACCIRTQLQRQDPIHPADSMEAPITDDESDPITLGEAVPDPAAEAAFKSVEDRGRREAVEALLSCLSNQQMEVIRARYWQGLTLEQVGQQIGMSRNGAAQLEKKALRVLRHPSHRAQLMRCL